MQQKQVRTLFIVVFIFLPIQYVFVGVVGYYHSEPWPAFVFPGFKNAFIGHDGFETDRTQFLVYGTDTTITLTPRDLFPEIPNSQIAGFVRKHFGDEGLDVNFSETGIKWLERQAARAANQDISALKVVRIREYWSGKSGVIQPDSSETIFKRSIYFESDDGQ